MSHYTTGPLAHQRAFGVWHWLFNGALKILESKVFRAARERFTITFWTGVKMGSGICRRFWDKYF
jgi:hypothetical protein